MRDLKTLREGWDEVARAERRSAEQLTIEQSLIIYLSLCRDMAPQMEETEETFRRDRETYLTELQWRLLRLNVFRRQQHGNLFPTEDLENWEASSEKQAREVNALAADWHDLSPMQVGARLLHLESEAALAAKTHPRLTWLLCQGLAERADSFGNWVNEFIDQGLPPDTVFPFLQRAARRSGVARRFPPVP